MQISLLSIGDELLIGQTINTNVAWMGEELMKFGAFVNKSLVVKDTKEAILSGLNSLLVEHDVVLITGGLGPTKDDITKKVLAEYFNTELVLYPDVLARVQAFFDQRKRPMLPVNELQAHLPKDATILANNHGTASGMWFERDGKVVVSMPGVPYEMKGLCLEHVFPALLDKFDIPKRYSKTIFFQGIGESYLAEDIKLEEEGLSKKGISLSYLPSPGLVKLRFNGEDKSEVKTEIENCIKVFKNRLSKYLYSTENRDLAGIVIDLLKKHDLKLGTVESCTGGNIARSLTSVSGASEVFYGGMVTYDTDMKINQLGINASLIEKCGVVSKEVVEEMATKGCQKLGVNLCIASTGYASDSPDIDPNRVGEVWLAVAANEVVRSIKVQLGTNRQRNIDIATLTVLNALRLFVEEKKYAKKQ